MIEIKLLARTPAEAIVILAAVQDVLDKKKVPLVARTESAAPVTEMLTGAKTLALLVTEGKPAAADPTQPKQRQRGERSDKGVKRGSYKQNAAAEPAPAEAHKAEPSGVTPSPAAAPQTAAQLVSEQNGAGTPVVNSAMSEAVAAVPTEAEVQKAIEAAHGRTSTQAMMDLFARYGVRRGRDLLPEQRVAFVTECATLGVTV